MSKGNFEEAAHVPYKVCIARSPTSIYVYVQIIKTDVFDLKLEML